MLGPLLGAALDNALRSGDAALTGPVARGDAGTVAAHVAELRKHAPGTVAGHPAMARATADRALAHGLLKPELAEDLLGVLADGATLPDDGERPMTTTLLRTADELHARVRRGSRAVVMTMGALHEGHATLIRAAREIAGPEAEVVVTVFVNPLQFGAGEDLDRYPRTLDADLKIAEAGADAVFAPSVDEVYPGGDPQVRLSRGSHGRAPGGCRAPRSLRRDAHRRRQAVAPHPARRGAVRAEGRPAARPDPPHGARPELRRGDRRRAHRA